MIKFTTCYYNYYWYYYYYTATMKGSRQLSVIWARTTQSMTQNPTFRRFILIVFPIRPMSSKVVYFPLVPPPKSCMNFSCPQYVLHVPHISFSLIWSPKWYLVRSTDQKALRPPLCSPFQSDVTSSLLSPNVFLTTLFSNTLGFELG